MTESCPFCHRELPEGASCGPTETEPCRCCGMKLVALAEDQETEDESTSE